MPQQKVYADPEIYQFLLRHPDMVIGFWEQLGATQLSLREVRENHYVLRETGGTVATIEVLHRTDSLCIIYARGEYRGPLLLTPYQGEVILVLRTRYTRNEMNEPMVVSDLDAFIQINSLGVDMLAKLFFAPLARVADNNFEVTLSFISQVSRAAARNPDMLREATEEITSVRPEVCAAFLDVVDRAAMRFARRNQPMPQHIARPQPQQQPQQQRTQQPIVAQPPAAAPQSISTQPIAAQPIAAQPFATPQPAPPQPIAAQPFVTQPFVTQPIAAQPAGTQSISTQTITSISTQPIAAQPIAAQPIAAQPTTVQPRGSHQDFAFSSRPPADWGMDHFFDASQSNSPRFESPQPFYEPVRFETTGELAAPRQIEPGRSVNTAPRLPRSGW